jgi:multidrug resistance efflux pump
MAKIENTIATLELKLKQAKALKQKVEARKKAAEQKANRSQDTRRKILVGSFFIQRAETDEQKEKLRHLLDAYLTRTDDRALFKLPPLAEAKADATNDDSGAAMVPD